MTKLKTIGLCVATALATVVLTFGITGLHEKGSTASLTVTVPPAVSKGDLVECKAVVQNPSWFLSKTIYQWKVLNSKGEQSVRAVSDSDIFFPSGLTDNKFWVICSAVSHHNYFLWSTTTPLAITVNSVVVGDSPSPTPTPGPVPPAPTPVSDHLFAVMIFDSTQASSMTPDQIKLKGSQTIGAAVKNLDTEWKEMDKANPALADASWQAEISKVKLPALFLMNKDGHTYSKLPVESEADALAQINKVRSGK